MILTLVASIVLAAVLCIAGVALHKHSRRLGGRYGVIVLFALALAPVGLAIYIT